MIRYRGLGKCVIAKPHRSQARPRAKRTYVDGKWMVTRDNVVEHVSDVDAQQPWHVPVLKIDRRIKFN